jgi:hypothetical protein
MLDALDRKLAQQPNPSSSERLIGTSEPKSWMDVGHASNSQPVVQPPLIFASPSSSESADTAAAAFDSLSAFLTAYDPAGAILFDGSDVPAQENGGFGALRRRHPHLVSSLRSASGEGRKRTTTVLDGRSVRWTVTRQPSADSSTYRVIVLAQDTGDDHRPWTEFEVDEDAQSSMGSTTTIRRLASSHGSNDGSVSVMSAPLNVLSHCAECLPPSAGALMPSIPRAPNTDRSWMSDPRCAALVSGGGEMGNLLRAVDWAHTPLGPVTSWSTTQLMIIGVVLHSRFPAALFWGPHRYLLYNSPYSDILGPAKHPHAFAQPVSVIWAEIWGDIGPLIQNTFNGEACLKEDDQLLIYRGNRDTVEEASFTWSYIPIYDGDTVVAVYNPVYETTGKVFSERRMRALQQLATRFTTARTLTTLVVNACEVLGQLEDDLPYAAAYVVQKDEFVGSATGAITLILQETIAIPFDAPAAPNKLIIDPTGPSPIPFCAPARWPIDLRRTVGQHELSLHVGVAPLLTQLPPRGSVGQSPTRAASLPIVQGDELVGVLILYIGSGVPVDDQMNNFLDLLARQCSASASMVASYEHEMQSERSQCAHGRTH